MSTIIKKVIILLLLFMSSSVCAGSIVIGDAAFNIPSPPGFAAVTPEMESVYEFQKQFVHPASEQFLAFIPESEIGAALNNKIPDLERTFSVQTAKKLINIGTSTATFVKLKESIKLENENTFKKAEEKLPGLMEKINKGIEESFLVNSDLSVSQAIPLPPHYETDRILSYSAFVKYGAKDASGNPFSYVSVSTVTFIHLKNKVLFLYSFAKEDDLEWSRNISKQWANSIVEQNPEGFRSSVKESLPHSVAGIDWGEVVGKGIAGGLVAILVGLVTWAARKKSS